jgi:D-sedoheptulose 7-phosphate isomerase
MKNIEYFKQIQNFLGNVSVKDNFNKSLILEDSFRRMIKLISGLKKKKNKIMFIGNGGSASISSHMGVDFLKNAGVPAITFNDASLITCISNDLGYENVFKKPIEVLANEGDILVAISSSGCSKNILEATKAAIRKHCFVITLSGFDTKNPLHRLGDINFYINSHSYGYVEIVHFCICHCLLDMIIEKNG